MSSTRSTNRSTAASSALTAERPATIRRLADAASQADAVVLGAGSGLSAAAGLSYSGPRFARLFPDFIEEFGLTDMYSSGFYPFPTPEHRWAYWSRHIMANRYDNPILPLYQDLRGILEGLGDTDHFVITTNVDHAFAHMASTSRSSSPLRATTGCGSVPFPATPGRGPTSRPCERWWSGSGTCASHHRCCPYAPGAGSLRR